MPTFGKRAADRQNDAAQNEYYVKSFKEKRTDIRFLFDNPKEDFVEIKEHFDKTNKISYPCAKFEGAQACIGCDYPVEHPEWSDVDEYFPNMKFNEAKDERKKQDPGWGVRDVSSKWLFAAIDPKGFVSVYKIGYKFWNDLCELHELMGTITDKDYAIIRSGETWNTTGYQAQAISQPYERKAKVSVPTVESISSVLGGKYVYAMEKYGMDTSGMDDGPAPVPADEWQNGPDPAPVDVVDPANLPAANRLPAAEPVTPAQPGDVASEALAARINQRAEAGLPGPDPSLAEQASQVPAFIPREADSGEIRDWLTENGVEVAKGAQRSTLVKLAESKMAEIADPPPF